MDGMFLLKCFVIGVSAASALGPVFVLTFNNGALRGFLKGFFTALGAALGDGLLMFLGFMGTLSVLHESHKYQVAIDFVGGFLMFGFGIVVLLTPRTLAANPSPAIDSPFFMVIKTFLSTVFNPLALLFFMFISAQFFASGIKQFTLSQILTGASLTGLGSLSVLALVAYIASRIGNAVSFHRLRWISVATGVSILCVGAYFFFDAIKVLYRVYVQ